MAATIPENEPTYLTAGDTAKWKRYFADYLPTTWTLSYALVNSSGQVTITASDNGDGYHLVNVAAATTAGWTSGDYRWQAYVTDGTDRYQVGQGAITIRPNFSAQSSGLDARSDIKKTLDAIEATLLNKASQDQLSYSIQGRSISRMPPEELLRWRAIYKRLYNEEQAADRLASGLATGNRVLVRM